MKRDIFKNYDFTKEYEMYAIENLQEKYGQDYEPTEEEILNEMYALSDYDFDDFMFFLNRLLDTHTLVAVGRIGRWNGTFDVHLVINSKNEFYKLVEDCDYVHIYEEDGKLMVEGIHHDGENLFELRTLTSMGEKIAYNHNDTYKNMTTNFYSKKTHYEI